MSNRWGMTTWEDLFRELSTGEPAAYKEIGGGPRDFGPNYKQQELKHSLEATKPSIHTKDGKVVPITPGSKNDSFVNTDIPSNKDTPLPGTASRYNADGSKRDLGVGFGEPASIPGSAAENANRAITELRDGGGGTRWVGANSTWVSGRTGDVIAPHVKDIPKSTTAASQIQQVAPAQVKWRSGLIPRGSGYGRWQSADVVGKGMPSNPQIYSKATEAKILAERAGTQATAQAANIANTANAAQIANTTKAAELAAKTGPLGGKFNASLANKANIVAAVATLAQMLGPKGKQGWTAANKEIGADMAGGVVDLEDLYT